MPYKRRRVFRRRRPFKTRRFRARRFSRRRRRVSGWGSCTAFPNSVFRHFRYTEDIAVDFVPEAPGVQGVVYRANSLFDPRYAVGGHSPMNFNIYRELYHHYLVHKCKATIRFIGMPSTAQSAQFPKTYWCGIYKDADDTLLSTSTSITENGKGKWKMLSTTPASGNQQRLAMWFGIKKDFGVKDPLDNMYRLGALTNTNPADEFFFVVWAAPTTPLVAGDGTRIQIQIQLDYYASLHKKKNHPFQEQY